MVAGAGYSAAGALLASPSEHNCGTVRADGHHELAPAEHDYYAYRVPRATSSSTGADFTKQDLVWHSDMTTPC